jgi:hypothetical protein
MLEVPPMGPTGVSEKKMKKVKKEKSLKVVMPIKSVENVKPVENVKINCTSPTGVLFNSACPQNPPVSQQKKKKSSPCKN